MINSSSGKRASVSPKKEGNKIQQKACRVIESVASQAPVKKSVPVSSLPSSTDASFSGPFPEIKDDSHSFFLPSPETEAGGGAASGATSRSNQSLVDPVVSSLAQRAFDWEMTLDALVENDRKLQNAFEEKRKLMSRINALREQKQHLWSAARELQRDWDSGNENERARQFEALRVRHNIVEGALGSCEEEGRRINRLWPNGSIHAELVQHMNSIYKNFQQIEPNLKKEILLLAQDWIDQYELKREDKVNRGRARGDFLERLGIPFLFDLLIQQTSLK